MLALLVHILARALPSSSPLDVSSIPSCTGRGAMSDGFENLLLEDLDEASGNHFTVRILSRTTPTRLVSQLLHHVICNDPVPRNESLPSCFLTPPLLQEVPAPFSAATGWPGAVQCAVVTSLRNPLEWPLRMTQLSSSSCVGTAISDSYGWSKLTEHMAVSVGDVLDFELVDERCLLASIAYSRGRVPEVVPQEAQVRGGHSPRIAPEEPQVVNDSTPHFKKKLRPSHTRAHKSARLVSYPLNLCSFTLVVLARRAVEISYQTLRDLHNPHITDRCLLRSLHAGHSDIVLALNGARDF